MFDLGDSQNLALIHAVDDQENNLNQIVPMPRTDDILVKRGLSITVGGGGILSGEGRGDEGTNERAERLTRRDRSFEEALNQLN